ncbi:MAG: SRPBCC domain-containing protein [Rhizomicrobium sp.]
MSRPLNVATPSDTEIVMTRVFDAPRGLVFDAYTKPAMLRGWLGGADWTIDGCEVDLRVGGTYCWSWHNAKGKQLVERGTYREIVPGARIVAVSSFDEPWYPGHCVETIAFAGHGNTTALTTTLRYDTREARDIALNAGVTRGVTESYERLDAVLAASGHGESRRAG